MKKFIFLFALLFAGCIPEDSVWWSPDGQTAAIRTSDGLRFSDAAGKLSAPVLSGDVQSAVWTTDGSALIVARSFAVKTWPQAEALIPSEEARTTRALASAVPALLKAILTASGGSLESLNLDLLRSAGITEPEQLDPVWSAAVALHREEIVSVAAGFPNFKELETKLFSDADGIRVYELSKIPMQDRKPAGVKQSLARSLRPLLNPVVSRHHSIIAFETGEGLLKAVTLDAKESMLVDDEHVRSATWSNDGRSLLYLVIPKTDKIGEIRARTIVNSNHELLNETNGPKAAPAPETLALAPFTGDGPSPRLASLPDGRVLFASASLNLPVSAKSISPRGQFFLLDPSKPETSPEPVKVTDGSLPDDLNAFAISPNGEFVALVEAGTDIVAVLELSAGKVRIISPSRGGWKSRLVPAWRNNEELTFAALPADRAMRPELMLWKTGESPKILSKDWPDDLVKPWLKEP